MFHHELAADLFQRLAAALAFIFKHRGETVRERRPWKHGIDGDATAGHAFGQAA